MGEVGLGSRACIGPGDGTAGTRTSNAAASPRYSLRADVRWQQCGSRPHSLLPASRWGGGARQSWAGGLGLTARRAAKRLATLAPDKVQRVFGFAANNAEKVAVLEHNLAREGERGLNFGEDMNRLVWESDVNQSA